MAALHNLDSDDDSNEATMDLQSHANSAEDKTSGKESKDEEKKSEATAIGSPPTSPTVDQGRVPRDSEIHLSRALISYAVAN